METINSKILKNDFTLVHGLECTNPLQDSRCKLFIDANNVYGLTTLNPANGTILGKTGTRIIDLVQKNQLSSTTSPTYVSSDKSISLVTSAIQLGTTYRSMFSSVGSCTVFLYCKLNTSNPNLFPLRSFNSGGTVSRFSASFRVSGSDILMEVRYTDADGIAVKSVTTILPYQDFNKYHLYMFTLNLTNSKVILQADNYRVETTITGNTSMPATSAGQNPDLFNPSNSPASSDINVKHISVFAGTPFTIAEENKIRNYIKTNYK